MDIRIEQVQLSLFQPLCTLNQVSSVSIANPDYMFTFLFKLQVRSLSYIWLAQMPSGSTLPLRTHSSSFKRCLLWYALSFPSYSQSVCVMYALFYLCTAFHFLPRIVHFISSTVISTFRPPHFHSNSTRYYSLLPTSSS